MTARAWRLSSTERICTLQRQVDWNVDHPRESPRRKGNAICTRVTGPRKKRWRVSRYGGTSDGREQNDYSDDEFESIVDVPRELRRVPKVKLQFEPKHTLSHASSPLLPVLTSISVHVRNCAHTPAAPLAVVLISHTPPFKTSHQLARRRPADGPASICTHGDHDSPARTQPSACVARSSRPWGRALGRSTTVAATCDPARFFSMTRSRPARSPRNYYPRWRRTYPRYGQRRLCRCVAGTWTAVRWGRC